MLAKLIKLIIVLMLCVNVQAVTILNYYVDPDATGNNDGGRDGADPNDPSQEDNWTDAFVSLAVAEDTLDSTAYVNLTTTDVVLKFVCRGGDVGAVTFNGFTTDSDNYLWLYGYDFPTDGIFDANYSHVQATNVVGLTVSDNHFICENMQFDVNATGTGVAYGYYATSISSGNQTVKECIFKGVSTSTGSAYGIGIGDPDAIATIYNNIIYGFINGSDTSHAGINIASGTTVNVYNNTVSGCYRGISDGSDGTVTLKNNAVFNNTDDFYGAGIDSMDYNASDDDESVADANWVNISSSGTEADDWALAFTDYSNGNFSIKDASSVLYNAGADLSGSGVTTDIIGTARPQATTYDIGAYEFIVAGTPAVKKPRIININMN